MDPGGRGRSTFLFLTGVILLTLAFAGSLVLGAVRIPVSDILAWALGQLPEGDLAGRVLTGIRLPRSLSAVAVGAGLGVAGAALQGIHRTLVVDGHLVGMSAAAGFGVAIGHAFGPSDVKVASAVMLGAAAGALYGLVSRKFGQTGGGPVVLVLIGIAAGLAMTAWTGLFVLAIDSPAVPTLSFFIFGSLSGASTTTLVVAVPLVSMAIGGLWWMGPGLDLLSLGEQESIHLGFDATRRVPAALAVIGMGVGASVALGGVIGFVGLIVPLALRPIFGPSQRVLIPASGIGGAIAVLIFDVAARTVASPVEIPIGLLTASIGGPVLVWLVRREATR